ncbi:GlxA family transcriptional regulator [Amaricoccus tamworthensis]|uniref:GlxA family transcriptional regulator n=1 Tax=Amaricoccus tamworthensis TaxID=57002 RepID=UPI003C7AF13D
MNAGPSPRAERMVFLLLENFTLSAFAGAIEPLRLANHISNTKLYDWVVVSEDGNPVTSSSGVQVSCDQALGEFDRDTTIIVIGGIGIKQSTTKTVLNWLRRESRRGMAIGAVCTGAYAIASAGLLNGKRCTTHWENRDSFMEEFPEIELTQSVFIIDQNRYTAAGGSASFDMMLNLVARKHGTDLANQVADQLIHTSLRSESDEQRLSIPTRIGVRHPKLAKVVQEMENNIEETISPSTLAKDVGMSTRQLERLFRRYMNRSPKRYYMELRLKKARNLLLQTDMSVINVALACGFASPSHFSKCYRSMYSTTPYRERGASDGEH